MFTEIIQNVATGGAVLLAMIYLVGGLIVNLNLSRRGVIEFEILKTKYLVAGLVFILHAIGTLTLAALPALALLLFAGNHIFLQLINVASMLSAAALLLIWVRYPSNTASRLANWWFWVFASAIGYIFPMLVLLRQMIAPASDVMWVILSFQAVLTGALAFLAQSYHYSAFYYGRAHSLGNLDPIGIGAPIRVQLACDESVSSLLKGLGISINNAGVTNVMYLLDETSHHYILSGCSEINAKENTFKIDKTAVKAILFCQAPGQKLAEKSHFKKKAKAAR